jgi:hypothetical protein
MMKQLFLQLFFFISIYSQLSINTDLGLQGLNSKYSLSPNLGLKYSSDSFAFSTNFFFSDLGRFDINNSFNYLEVEEIADQLKLQNLKILPNSYQLKRINKSTLNFKFLDHTGIDLRTTLFIEDFTDNKPEIRTIDNGNLLVLYDTKTSNNYFLLNRIGLEHSIYPFKFGLYKEFLISKNKSIPLSSYRNIHFSASAIFNNLKLSFENNREYYDISTSLTDVFLDEMKLAFRFGRESNEHVNLEMNLKQKIQEDISLRVSFFHKLKKIQINQISNYKQWFDKRYYFNETYNTEISIGLDYQFPIQKVIAISVIESQLNYPEVFSGLADYYLSNPFISLKIKNLEKKDVFSTIKIIDSKNKNVTLSETINVKKSKSQYVNLYLNPEYLGSFKWSERKNLKVVLIAENEELTLMEFPLHFFAKNIWSGDLKDYKYFVDYKNTQELPQIREDISKLKTKLASEAETLTFLIKKYLKHIEFISDPEFSHGYDEIRNIERIFSDKKADCEDLVNLFSVILSEMKYDVYLLSKKGTGSIENHLYLLVDTHIRTDHFFKSGFNENITLPMKSKNNELSIWLAIELTEFRSGLSKMLSVGKENYLEQSKSIKQGEIECLNCF